MIESRAVRELKFHYLNLPQMLEYLRFAGGWRLASAQPPTLAPYLPLQDMGGSIIDLLRVLSARQMAVLRHSLHSSGQ